MIMTLFIYRRSATIKCIFDRQPSIFVTGLKKVQGLQRISILVGGQVWVTNWEGPMSVSMEIHIKVGGVVMTFLCVLSV